MDGFLWAVAQSESGEECFVEKFNITTNTWELMESIGWPHGYTFDFAQCPVVALDGFIYVVGMEQMCAPTVLISNQNIII